MSDIAKRASQLRVKPLTAVRVSATDLVREEPLQEESALPLVLQATSEVNLAEWVTSHRERLMGALLDHGGLLFRGFDVDSPAKFGAVARALTPNLLGYVERAAARTEVAPNVFTSTELAADQVIPHHHEMSYSHNWPRYVWFHCALSALQGGRTPLASERRFYPHLQPAIKRRFMANGVMYVRNFGLGLDLTWQQAFQTESRSDVEAYCRRSRVAFEWLDHQRLRTRQIRQAISTHPETGETVWFNHAHMFHESNLVPELRESLVAAFGSEGLPRNAYYGDGTPIETSVLDEIRAGYSECEVSFPWRAGDVLLLDNFLTVHGRQAYQGARRILVAMADLYTESET